MNVLIPISGTQKAMGGDSVFIIAEIGKNFIQTQEERPQAEYIYNAKELISAAAESGVDAVKFQTHVLEDEFMPGLDVVSPHFKGSDRYAWIRRNEVATPLSFWQEIKAYAESLGLIFFSTPMSRKAAEKLSKLDVLLWKLGSGDVMDYLTIDFIAHTKKPLIISTGMVSFDELDSIVPYIQSRGIPLAILYCVSKYPCPPEDFNLASIERFREKYPNMVIGFSDHSVDGHIVDLAAVKLGASIIEKHFSFSRDLWGADHQASITPDEMQNLVKDIRNGAFKSVDTKPFYGHRERELEGATNQFRPYFQKSLVFGRDLKQGERITRDALYAVRPRMYIAGLPSENFDNVVGKSIMRSVGKYEPVTKDLITQTP